MIKPCCLGASAGDSIGKVDGLLWYKNLGHHVFGDFSMGVIQANLSLEDHSQLQSGPLFSTNSGPQPATFIGVYDGHGGPEAAGFANNNLFRHLKTFATDHQQMSEDIIRKAFAATEEDFLSLVRKQWLVQPNLASVGSCCLVGVICDGLLYIANAGDSRVVLGRLRYGERTASAVQLSEEHNANIQSVREELVALHPNDRQIVVKKHNVWRVKGMIQVSRSIGDAYLKKAEFNKEPLLPKFRLPETFLEPILSSEPSISVHRLLPQDQFLIFASDGLWEQLTNQEAVDIVQSSPRNGISRRLIKAALKEAARKREMRYSDLQKIDQGVRRHFHDDITVLVVFIDYSKVSHGSSNCSPSLSIKAGGGVLTPPIS